MARATAPCRQPPSPLPAARRQETAMMRSPAAATASGRRSKRSGSAVAAATNATRSRSIGGVPSASALTVWRATASTSAGASNTRPAPRAGPPATPRVPVQSHSATCSKRAVRAAASASQPRYQSFPAGSRSVRPESMTTSRLPARPPERVREASLATSAGSKRLSRPPPHAAAFSIPAGDVGVERLPFDAERRAASAAVSQPVCSGRSLAAAIHTQYIDAINIDNV